MAISNKLQDILNCKAAIKDAIETKGVTVGSVPLSSYAEKILEIETGGGGDVIVYDYPLVKVMEEDWNSTTKEDNTLYAII
jgi:hypothetical protein